MYTMGYIQSTKLTPTKPEIVEQTADAHADMIKTPWAIYNTQIHACVYQVCIECVCEMHAHAFALHLCSFLWK